MIGLYQGYLEIPGLYLYQKKNDAIKTNLLAYGKSTAVIGHHTDCKLSRHALYLLFHLKNPALAITSVSPPSGEGKLCKRNATSSYPVYMTWVFQEGTTDCVPGFSNHTSWASNASA